MVFVVQTGRARRTRKYSILMIFILFMTGTLAGMMGIFYLRCTGRSVRRGNDCGDGLSEGDPTRLVAVVRRMGRAKRNPSHPSRCNDGFRGALRILRGC